MVGQRKTAKLWSRGMKGSLRYSASCRLTRWVGIYDHALATSPQTSPHPSLRKVRPDRKHLHANKTANPNATAFLRRNSRSTGPVSGLCAGRSSPLPVRLRPFNEARARHQLPRGLGSANKTCLLPCPILRVHHHQCLYPAMNFDRQPSTYLVSDWTFSYCQPLFCI